MQQKLIQPLKIQSKAAQNQTNRNKMESAGEF